MIPIFGYQHRYATLCEMVSWSVSFSFCWFVPLVQKHAKAVSALKAISNINAPAQKHTTDDAIYS